MPISSRLTATGSMPDSNSRTQVLIAIIGLTGVLGAALIANWDKFSGKQPTSTAASDSRPRPHDPNSGSNATPPHKQVPNRISLDGRLFDQPTNKVLCNGTISLQVGGVHQVQRADAEGRYAFELDGFAPTDELTLDAKAAGHRDISLKLKLSDLPRPQDLVFQRQTMSDVIGGVSGGGKGAAIGAAMGAGPGLPANCADSSGPLPAYARRPDSLLISKN